MITLLVYFSGELWQLSARMTRQRLWQTIGFLSLVALVFIATTIRDEVRALRDDRSERAEQLNVVAVMVVSQAGETTCRTGEPPCAGTWFGVSVPLPQTLVQTSLLVAVISGLYFTVNTSTDPQYRSRFFDPLIAYLELEQAH